jgi:hypothetical protein
MNENCLRRRENTRFIDFLATRGAFCDAARVTILVEMAVTGHRLIQITESPFQDRGGI